MTFYERFRQRRSPAGVVYYADGDCGHFKTTKALSYIRKYEWSGNVLYLSPSIELIKQVAQKAKGPAIVIVHSIDDEGHSNVKRPAVRARLLEAMRDAPASDTMIFGTHQAYLMDALELPRRNEYQLIIDENFQIDSFYDFEFGQLAQFLNEHLAVVRWNETLYTVVARDAVALRRIVEGPPSEMLTTELRELFRYVLSPIRDVYVCAQSWKRVVEGATAPEAPKDHRIYFLAMINEVPFKDGGVTILSANFTQSLTYRYLQMKGIRFEPHPFIRTSPPQVAMPPGDRLRIRYLLPDRDLTSTFANTPYEDGTIADELDRIVAKYFEEERQPFLGIVHNDRRLITPLAKCPLAKLISPISHGRNDLANYNAIYFGTSVNRTTKHFQMLEALGLPSDFVRAAHTGEIIHQNLFRTNLRNHDSTATVTAVISGKYDAEAEADRLQCSDICKLGDFPRTRPIPVGSTDRSRRSRSRKMFDRLLDRPSMDEAGIDPYRVLVAYHREGTGRKVFFGEDFKQQSVPILDFVKEFKKLHRTEHPNKLEIPFFTPARFKQCNVGVRRKAGFAGATVIPLDIDNGICFDVLDDLFWTKASPADKLAYFAYSTWQHDESRRRYRVVFFLKSPVYTIEEYQHVLGVIVKRLKDAGYSDADIGLDPGVKSGNKCYVLPGRPEGSPKDWGFFIKRGCRDMQELEQYCLDPIPYLQTAVKAEKEMSFSRPADDDVADPDVAQLAHGALAPLAAMKEGRHDALWNAMWPLVRHHKMNVWDLGRICRDYFAGDTDMLKKVHDNLLTLSKS